MKIYKTAKDVIVENDGKFYLFKNKSWDTFINRDNLHEAVKKDLATTPSVGDAAWFAKQRIQAPIKSQEVWAAGVTYMRSKVARMEESKESGGATFYDKVYDAERPEIFFKATPNRVVGTNGKVRIRPDSTWDVPEPELALFVNKSKQIVGYSIGNDMSSRSIEGENPLYLPQAKCYDQCAGLGPCVYVPAAPIAPETLILMTINRGGKEVFRGDTPISQMKRKHTELVEFLTRCCTFPKGVFLMTGTCIVPDLPFTLQSGDEILISIDHIGTLRNVVA